MKQVLIALITLVTFQASAITEDDKWSKIFTPAGNSCLITDACAGDTTPKIAASRNAEQIVNTFCSACHSPQMAPTFNAPEIGSKEAWSARIANKGDINALLEQAIKGLNLMPPKGNCIDCTNDELKSAIEFMAKDSL